MVRVEGTRTEIKGQCRGAEKAKPRDRVRGGVARREGHCRINSWAHDIVRQAVWSAWAPKQTTVQDFTVHSVARNPPIEPSFHHHSRTGLSQATKSSEVGQTYKEIQ